MHEPLIEGGIVHIDLALLIVRLAAGGILAAHGAQKLFGWFGGSGLAGTGGFLQSMGFRRGHAWLVGLTEFGAGLALAAGFLTPLAAAGVIGVMCTAIAVAHWKSGFFNTNGGYEFPLLLATAAWAMSISGAGRYSVDRALDWHLGGTDWGIAAFVVGVVGAFVITTTRGVGLRAGDRSVHA